HPLKDRRLVELEPDINREDQQEDGNQKRDAPAPVQEGGGIHVFAAKSDDYEREQEPERGGSLDPAGGEAALVGTRMLRDVSGRSAVFAAQRQTLQEPKRDQE